MYGQTLMVITLGFVSLTNFVIKNPKRFSKTSIKSGKSAKTAQKMIGLKGITEICPNVFEVSSKNKKIVERYPIHVGLTVLHLSKLIMLEFICFLYDTLIKDSFEFIYTGSLKSLCIQDLFICLDTDSLAVALTDDLEKLVKPEKKDEWPILKNKWFVVDLNNPRDLRFPGKMKTEWETTSGAMIA